MISFINFNFKIYFLLIDLILIFLNKRFNQWLIIDFKAIIQYFLFMGRQELVSLLGKTHTMGTLNQLNNKADGMIPLTLGKVFDLISKK